jgi:hypothetical protein
MKLGTYAVRTGNRIRRRALLGGALGASLALPWLEVTSDLARAAAVTPPKRFLVFFVPGGVFDDLFWPTTTSETDFTLSSILQPLAPFKKQMLVLDGIEVKTMADGYGHPHARGMTGLLTGVSLPQGPYDFFIGGPAGFPNSTSLDHVIGDRISSTNKFKTLEFGVLWPTYENGALPTNIISYSGPGQPAPPMADPYEAFMRLFSDLGGAGQNAAAAQLKNRKTRIVLDATAQEFAAIRPLVGAADQRRLDEHLQRFREIERSLDASVVTTSASCHKPDPSPTVADRVGYDTGGAVSELGNGGLDLGVSARIPTIGKQMMDMLVLSFACDLSRVASLAWTDAASRAYFPWLGLSQNHHYYQHFPGQAEHGKILNWYMQQLAYLLGQLASIPEGDHTLLDSTLVYFGSEIGYPQTHGRTRVPRILFGGGSTFRMGRVLKVANASHNDLLVSLQNAFGIDSGQFGDPKYTTGPLNGLV